MHLAPSALEKKEFRETWQVTALRDRVRTRYFQRKETRVLQEARRFPCVHLLYLSESQLERIKPFFPRSHGAPRVDDRRVVSDIIYGLPDVRLHPPQNSPHGVNSAQKEDSPRLIGRTKGGLNSKLHAVCDGHGRPVLLLLTEGQVSDYKGAAILQHLLPDNSIFLADGGYDASWLRESLKAKGITVCIPPRKTRNEELPFDKTLYKGRHLIENTFSKLKDWRRIATRYDRCAHTFFSAICLAVTVLFYLN